MTSLWKRVGTGAGAGSPRRRSARSAATNRRRPCAVRSRAAAGEQPLRRPLYIVESRRPSSGAAFDGRVGIAVKSIDEGWATGWKADELYPQQSVSKLWVSITAMDAVDKGKVSLDDQVTLTRDDLTLFHQPIADEMLKTGSFTTTLGDLMVQADHHQRQYRQRQADALGRRSRRGARDDHGQAPRRDPLRQWRARAAEQDRRA